MTVINSALQSCSCFAHFLLLLKSISFIPRNKVFKEKPTLLLGSASGYSSEIKVQIWREKKTIFEWSSKTTLLESSITALVFIRSIEMQDSFTQTQKQCTN